MCTVAANLLTFHLQQKNMWYGMENNISFNTIVMLFHELPRLTVGSSRVSGSITIILLSALKMHKFLVPSYALHLSC
jgi:hypothetical protein